VLGIEDGYIFRSFSQFDTINDSKPLVYELYPRDLLVTNSSNSRLPASSYRIFEIIYLM
jgi:hypothetical protein